MKKAVHERYRIVLHTGTDATARILWIRVNGRGEPDGQQGATEPDALSALSARFPDDTFHLLVPMADVTLHRVRLPGRHNAAGMQALPWLLEDKLAVSPETVTIVPLASEGEDVQVAVVDSARLERWTAPFNAAGIPLQQVIADALLLPPYSVLRWEERWLLHMAEWQGAEVESGWLALWYAAWRSENPHAEEISCYGAVPADLPQCRSLPLQEPLTLLAAGTVKKTFSLLLPPSSTRRRTKYGPLIMAFATVLILLFIQQGLTLWQLTKQGDALQQQLQRYFPNQRASEWRIARKENGSGLAHWLASLPALPEGVTVNRLHYLAAPLQLQLTLHGETAQTDAARRALAATFNVQSGDDGSLMLTRKERQP